MKIIKKIIYLLIAGIIILSIVYSKEFYRFYNMVYYNRIKRESSDDMLKNAYQLLKKGHYTELKKYLDKVMLLYPNNREAKRLYGINIMRLGDKRKGVDIVLSTIDGEKIQPKILEEIIQVLYEQRLYTDIIYVLEKNGTAGNSNIMYYYGISLYETGKYNRGVQEFKNAIQEGKKDYIIYYYTGLAYMKMNDFDNALTYMKEASDLNNRDRDVNKCLVILYRKMNKYSDAEKILRRLRKY